MTAETAAGPRSVIAAALWKKFEGLMLWLSLTGVWASASQARNISSPTYTFSYSADDLLNTFLPELRVLSPEKTLLPLTLEMAILPLI